MTSSPVIHTHAVYSDHFDSNRLSGYSLIERMSNHVPAGEEYMNDYDVQKRLRELIE